MKSEGNVADLEKADEWKMRYYAREVEQADRESKARFVAPENTQEELPPNSGGPSSSSTLWKPLGKRSGEEELDGTRPQKRERDGDEAEDERLDRYQAAQEDNKDMEMEEVKSFNKVAFEMKQKFRDERMHRLFTNNPNTDECWNINAKKVDGRSGPVRGKVEATNSSSGAKLGESYASLDSIGTGAAAI